MTTNLSYIANDDGRFYAGMTAKEARQNNSYKCTIRRDFRNLDKNNNGILSVQEIMKERKRESNVALFSTFAWLALGIGDALFEKSATNRALWLVIDTVITGISAINFYKIKKKTNEYNDAIIKANNKNLNKLA